MLRSSPNGNTTEIQHVDKIVAVTPSPSIKNRNQGRRKIRDDQGQLQVLQQQQPRMIKLCVQSRSLRVANSPSNYCAIHLSDKDRESTLEERKQAKEGDDNEDVIVKSEQEARKRIKEEQEQEVDNAKSDPSYRSTISSQPRMRNKGATTRTKATVQKRFKYSTQEKIAILRGVQEFGIGNWKGILNEYPHILANRSNVQIKDAYRTLVKQGIIKFKQEVDDVHFNDNAKVVKDSESEKIDGDAVKNRVPNSVNGINDRNNNICQDKSADNNSPEEKTSSTNGARKRPSWSLYLLPFSGPPDENLKDGIFETKFIVDYKALTTAEAVASAKKLRKQRRAKTRTR